jgi:hypothetical protein
MMQPELQPTLAEREAALERRPHTRGLVRVGARLELSLTHGHGPTSLRWLAPWLQHAVVFAWNAAPSAICWYRDNRGWLSWRRDCRSALARAYVAVLPVAVGVALAIVLPRLAGGGS